METMISTIYPFGSINNRIIKGVTKLLNDRYFIIDNVSNYILITESVYNYLLDNGIPYIEFRRKGV